MTLTRTHLSHFILLFLCAATLTGCDDKEFINPGGNTISFITVPDTASVTDNTRTTYDNRSSGGFTLLNEDATDTLFLFASVTDEIEPVYRETRAKPIDETNFDEFNVFAHLKTNGELQSNFYMADKVTKVGAEWNTDNTYYWPGAKFSLRFFAYTPTDLAVPKTSNSTTFTYTVPTDVAAQKDLMIAKTDFIQGDSPQPVSLTFNHLCTAVRFVTGDIDMNTQVTTIELSGIKNTGVYDIDQGKWNSVSGSGTYMQTVNKDLQAGEVASTPITDEGQTFMMLPQAFEGNTEAKVTVNFSDGKKVEARLANIKDASGNPHVWPMGGRVSYSISKLTGHINVTGDDENPTDGKIDVEAVGGSHTITIESGLSDGEDAPFNIEFAEGTGDFGETAPDWLTLEDIGNGKYVIDVAQQKPDDNHTKALEKATSKGTPEEPYNLSKNKEESINAEVTGMSTANCYIINAPGTYSFPVVYGNAIENGNRNEKAFYPNVGSYALRRFVNHLGNGITEPWIANNTDCNPKKAELVWEDAKDLVTNIELKGTSPYFYITFDIGKKTIQQGNAVIAVRDDNDILWSWHIWVTDYEPGVTAGYTDNEKTVSTYNNKKSFTFMSVPLGWCNRGEHEERDVTIKLTQKDDPTVQATITIKQKGYTIENNATYYQWGRKDPLVPSARSWDSEENNNKVYYKNDGKAYSTVTRDAWSSGITAIQNSIKQPDVINGTEEMDGTYVNLWNAGLTKGYKDEDVYNDIKTLIIDKTIYDPSPVGYVVPPSFAFSGFTNNGYSIYNDETDESKIDYAQIYSQKFNTPYSIPKEFDDNKGFKFYCRGMNGGTVKPTGSDVVFFHCVGERKNKDGTANEVCESGLYWSSIAYYNSDTDYNTTAKHWKYFSHCLFFTRRSVWQTLPTFRCRGVSVRPIEEE